MSAFQPLNITSVAAPDAIVQRMSRKWDSKSANKFALRRCKLGLVGTEIHVGGEVLDERQVEDDVEDDVDNLHIALRPRLWVRER